MFKNVKKVKRSKAASGDAPVTKVKVMVLPGAVLYPNQVASQMEEFRDKNVLHVAISWNSRRNESTLRVTYTAQAA